MFEEGLRDVDAWAAVQRLEPAFMRRFDLTDRERKVLERPTPKQLAELGVHPMLAMWGSHMRDSELARHMSASEYFRDRSGSPGNR